MIKWNKYFYCIINHDSEVGCKGLLFYGAVALPVIYPKLEDIETLSRDWRMLEQEMNSSDSLQEEMLQMMLKRILILCTRIYKEQVDLEQLDNSNVDIIKEYAQDCFSDDDFKKEIKKYTDVTPISKESLLYRSLFEKYFKKQSHLIPSFWMPNSNWDNCDVSDPSARVLPNYGKSAE